jgi:hypothetical protein
MPSSKPAFAATAEDIMGTSQLSGAQMAQWFRTKKGNAWGSTMQASLDTIANLYISEGALEGVRGDVAFIQAIKETGWFQSNCAGIRNNFSGLNAPATCTQGWVFTSPQEGIRSQIQQLRNYADSTPVEHFAHVPIHQTNNFGYKGDVTTWPGLGAKWAVSSTYGTEILAQYNQMINYFGIRGYCAEASAPSSQTSGTGYWTVAADGGINAMGGAPFYGSMSGKHLNAPVLGMAATPSGRGYWLVAADGGIFSFGDARFYGSTGSMKLNKPIVGMASTKTGRGYWLVASDGGIFSFGDARFYGSMGGSYLFEPVVGMAPTPSGRGYWLVATDGGIFSFGDARFFGSTGGKHLNQPVVAIAPRPQGDGYWLGAADGGVFSFGRAPFQGSFGSCSGHRFNSIKADASGNGYYMSSTDGHVMAFGDAKHFGYVTGSGRVGMAAR